MADKPLRFALVGAGMVSDAHARSIQELPEAELIRVFSRTEARAKDFAAKYGAEHTTDLDQVWASPDVDAVIITTAPYNHHPHAIAAMKAGKHALVEKPMAVATAECDEMMAVAAETKRTLGVVFQSRFKRDVLKLKEMVDTGRLGDLLHVSGYVKWYRPQSYYEANDWRGKVETEGGGVIFSQAGHTLDLMRWIGGPVDWVFTNMVTAPVHKGIAIENLGTVTLRFKNGATGVLEAATALYPGLPEQIAVHGSRGTIMLQAGDVVKWEIKDPTPGDAAPPAESEEGSGTGASDPMAFPITWHKMQIADFVDAVRTGRPTRMDGTQGRLLNELCEAVYESARTLSVVRL
ncbi:MAG: Gfo/Idh/MocA family oxidoreductase [Phycisphaerae bacterium]|nr:Gfo/Idh/MocA family oxidoreductase [Phycisphaerae bacterium]